MSNGQISVSVSDELRRALEAAAVADGRKLGNLATKVLADFADQLAAAAQERAQAEQRQAAERERLAKLATDHGLPPDADRLSIQQAVRKREIAEHDAIMNRWGGLAVAMPSDLPTTPDGTHVRDGSGEPGVDASKLAPTRHETFREQSIRDKVMHPTKAVP
jgi:hypothetical protein